jgi:methyl-accepting chemotaxis protein
MAALLKWRKNEPAEKVQGSSSQRASAPNNISAEWADRFLGVCEHAAAGDLEARVLHNDANTQEGRLGLALNHLLDMTDAFVRESRAALEHASQGKFYRKVLLDGMHGSFRHASGVINQATESMAGQAKAVRESDDSRLQLAGIVASSAEEMTASVGEVGRQTQESASVAGEAVVTLERVNVVMRELSEASNRVGELVKLISGIAQQTKMLSFNATIEAARAGAAGRGFAVVASEVRELAKQIGSATDGVTNDIQAMHKSAQDAAKAINSVGGTVGKMNDISQGIALSVQEQRTAMQDISKNARRAAESGQSR